MFLTQLTITIFISLVPSYCLCFFRGDGTVCSVSVSAARMEGRGGKCRSITAPGDGTRWVLLSQGGTILGFARPIFFQGGSIRIVAPGLQPGGLRGDLGWNPLDITITDRRRLVELQNGRAAMFAISAWVAADNFPGSVPLALPW